MKNWTKVSHNTPVHMLRGSVRSIDSVALLIRPQSVNRCLVWLDRMDQSLFAQLSINPVIVQRYRPMLINWFGSTIDRSCSAIDGFLFAQLSINPAIAQHNRPMVGLAIRMYFSIVDA